MTSRRGIFALSFCMVLLFSVLSNRSAAADEEHFLDYSEDNFKVAFMSGNLTASVTHDYPRVVFYHSSDPFSPTFEVGFPKMYIFNDSNGDGQFALSEMQYVIWLDENHVLWNVSTLEFEHEPVAGEYAHFRMNATLALYDDMENETVAVADWANITFWFRISENDVAHTNSYGSYVIKGKTDLSINFTIEVIKETNFSGIVVEQLLQGGGSTYMFSLKQKGAVSDVVDRMVSSRFDERVNGTDFTNTFNDTSLPDQEISYAKEDGTVQAYYWWDSEPSICLNGSERAAPLNCTFFTTGTGMLLHSAYTVSNDTGCIYQESSIGLDESAFVGKITNWIRDNIAIVIAVVVVIIAAVGAAIYFAKYRKRTDVDSAKNSGSSEKKLDDP